MSINLTEAQIRMLRNIADVGAELAAIVEWCVDNADQCLADNPHHLAQAKRVLANAYKICDHFNK